MTDASPDKDSTEESSDATTDDDFWAGLKAKVSGRIPSKLAVRIPLFVGFLLLVTSWLQRQLQWSPEALVERLSATFAGFVFVVPYARKLWLKFKKSAEEEMTVAMVMVAGTVLQTPVLVLLGLVALVVTAFLSTVTVMADGAPGTMAVALSPEESGAGGWVFDFGGDERSGELSSPEDVETFTVFTTPLGRPFVLQVTGYRRHSFNLFPGVGEQVRVTEDLKLAPAVLIRMPWRLAGNLKSDLGGEVRLYEVRDGERLAEPIARRAVRQFHGSYLFGHVEELPFHREDQWNREFQFEIRQPSSEERERAILAWTGFDVGEPPRVPLSPGMELEAEYLLDPEDSASVRGRVRFKITPESLQDHALRATPEDG